MSGFYSAGLFDAIPDSVASRPQDDTSTVVDDDLERGLEILVKSDIAAIAARISTMTADVTRAYLRDSTGSLLDSVDVSGSGGGDTFSFNADLTADSNYRITLDAEGSDYTAGFANDETDYPYTSSDVDITGQIEGSSVSQSQTHVVNDVGNPDNVLG